MANVGYARRAVKDCLRRFEAPIASQLLYTQEGILDDSIPIEREHGILAGLAWVPVADYSVFYTDRGWSTGMLAAAQSIIDSGAIGKLRVRGLDFRPQLPAILHPYLRYLKELGT